MSYTVLIADDEKMPRTVLREHICWDELNVSEIILASDGQEALEMARTHSPDIIISDMKMPRMNGLELAAAVREFLPKCQFIFLSGYSDKEYLKGAIKLKAASYVEKPIDLDEVTDALRSVINELSQQGSDDPAFLFFRGNSSDATPLNTQKYKCEKATLRQLDDYIRQNKQEDAVALLHRMYGEIQCCEGTSPDYLRHLYRQIIFTFLHSAESQNVQSITGQTDQLLYTEANQPTLMQLWDSIYRTADLYFAALHSLDADIVSRVERYLEKYYHESTLTVQGVADNLNFTYTYLCSAYKKACGKTVNQRLTEIRIQHAKELLSSSNQKLYEIAHAVGYADGKYFVKLFTRETGLSPKQYRGRQTNEE